MSLSCVLIVLLLTNLIHGGPVPVPAPPELLPVNHGRTLSSNMFDTVNTATAVNFLVSGINVLISWVSFLVPPSKMKGRLAVLITSFTVKMSIINNAFTIASTSDKLIEVSKTKDLDRAIQNV